MKKVQRIVLVIMAALFVSSCSREITVVKRHYRNGYHVELGDKRSKAVTQEVQLPSEQAEQPVSASSEKSNLDGIIAHQPLLLNKEVKSDPRSFSDVNSANLKDKKAKDGLSKAAAKMLIKHPAKLKKQLSEIKKASPRSDLGNIIWFLIVILLILWLLALLTGGWGLGGLIYLLLVVALILLILRLLGIV